MTETSKAPSKARADSAPEPRIVRKRQGISWIWIVPIVAALASLSMVARTWMMAGPQIVITFATGDGIEAGKTRVRYKEVTVGVVEEVRLSEDRSRVEVKAALNPDAVDVAREGSRFWVVRPRLGLSGVSGLSTIMSGPYIAVDIPAGAAKAASRHEFQGLASPPEVTSGQLGTHYTMRASTLGSLEVGSPVYFRRMRAGQVVGYQLGENGKQVDVQVFVDAPFDGFVSSNTRFWNASGLDVSMGAAGLAMRMQSLATVLAGGLAFEDVVEAGAAPIAESHVFELFGSEREARGQVDGVRMPVQFRIDGSVRGLARGAEVDFRGLSLGRVTDFRLGFDQTTRHFYASVDAEFYPERLGEIYREAQAQPDGEARLLAEMVKHGLRAQLRTSNFLTGQMYIALDFFQNAPPVSDYDPKREPRQIPVVPGPFDQTQQQIANIVSKLERLPLDKIGNDLQVLLNDASKLLKRLEKDVSPAFMGTLKQTRHTLSQVDKLMSSEGAMVGSIARTMQELARAARSLRELVDALQANPSSLIRGRVPDPQLFGGGR